MNAPTKRFYVYTLAYPDGTVFYVGKGQRRRIHCHENEARRGCKCPKCEVIRTIWLNGEMVIKTIVSQTNNEEYAYRREKEIIARYPFDSLCNRTGGGGGRSMSAEEYAYWEARGAEHYAAMEAKRAEQARWRNLRKVKKGA